MADRDARGISMYFDNDIELSAKAMLELFGDEALERARERADEYMRDGGGDGERFWREVLATLETVKNVGG